MTDIRFFALLVFLVFAIGYFTITSFIPPQTLGQKLGLVKPSPSPTSQTIPEMADILNTNQNIRLLATRRLVERVGVDNALEILNQSSLPHTGEGHLAVHQVGFYAYQKFGLDAILHCKDYFLFACYHGAIIEAASSQGEGEISKMTDHCKASPSRYFQCVHAAGHAILAMDEYDLPKALKTCDALYESETAFPEALSSCHNGAFMENLFGVHDWGTTNAPKRDWLSDSPYFPCTAFDEKYQKGCWLNQAARIYQMNQGDLVKTTQVCQAIGNDQYVAWCMDNLARQIHALTNGNIVSVFSLCQYLGPQWVDMCITVNANSYYSVGDGQTAVAICRQINPVAKAQCYQDIASQISTDIVAQTQKQALCQQMEEPFNEQCQGQIAPKI